MAEQADAYKWIEDHYRKKREGFVKAFVTMAGGYAQAEDVVQDAYVKALTYWKAFDAPADLDRMFPILVMNCYRDFKKDERRHGAAELTEDIEGPAFNFTNIIKQNIYKMIEAQAERDRGVLSLHFIKGFTQREIETLTNIPQGTVKDIVVKFRDHLKKTYGEGVLA